MFTWLLTPVAKTTYIVIDDINIDILKSNDIVGNNYNSIVSANKYKRKTNKIYEDAATRKT